MADYIDRAALLEQITDLPTWAETPNGFVPKKYPDGMFDCDDVVGSIEGFPAADVAPVRHGRWIEGAENFTCGNHNAECSVCHCYISWNGCDEDFNYCPNCGARMDGGVEDERRN